MVQVQKKSPEQWKETVYAMIGRGAQVMPDEIEPVAAYLAANAGTRPQTARTAGEGRQGPDGEGRALLQRNCQQCHDLTTASTKLPTEEWGGVVTKMMTYGVKLSAADQQRLVAYLNSLTK
jgi:mono/diheme cytochrome c family protein